MAKKDLCATPDCDDPAICAGFCGACYQWHWGWGQKGVKANQDYRKKMKRIESRIASTAMPKRAIQAAKQRGRGESRAYIN